MSENDKPIMIEKIEELDIMGNPLRWNGYDVIRVPNPYHQRRLPNGEVIQLEPDWSALGQRPPSMDGRVPAIDGRRYQRDEVLKNEHGQFVPKPEAQKREAAKQAAEEERLAKLPTVLPTPSPPPGPLISADGRWLDVSCVGDHVFPDWLKNPPGSLSGMTTYFLLPLAADTALRSLLPADQAYQHPSKGPSLVLVAGMEDKLCSDGVFRAGPTLPARHEIESVLCRTRELEEWRSFSAEKTGTGWLLERQRRLLKKEAVVK